MLDITPYLADLERRLDAGEEERLLREWRQFAAGQCPDELFAPRRRPVSRGSLEWPAISVNAAIEGDYALMLLSQLRGVQEIICSEGGHVPMVRANYGSTILPTIMGCELMLMDEAYNTLPGALALPEPEQAVRRLLDRGVPDLDRGQGKRVMEACAYYLETLSRWPKLSRYVHIYHPDWQGPLDIAEVVYGSGIFLAFYDEPELMQAFLGLITDMYVANAERYFRLLPPQPDVNYHYGWVHGGSIRISLDSCVNFSPEMYRELIMPHDQRLLRRFGGLIHSCGKVDHFAEVLPEIGDGYRAFNLSQPHLNDMERVFAATVDRGIPVYGLPWAAAQEALARRRPLRGLLHSVAP